MSTEIGKIIANVTEKTFNIIKQVYDYQKESTPEKRENITEAGSRILFPKYSEGHRKSKGIDRISEQELRFVFVEQLILYAGKNNLDIYYSVETPTDKAYVFSKDKGGPKVDQNGVSARIDLVLYKKIGNEFKRKALIEFKARNPDAINYRKDICKLINEESDNGCSKYFIHIINVKKQERTLKKILDDKIINIDALKEEGKNINYRINYICFNLYNKTGHKFITGEIRNNKLEDIRECESLSTAE